MGRMLTLAAGALTIAAATTNYALTFETQRIDAEVHGVERAIEKAENDIAVLRAERAYLGRPDRIDTLARKLGLEPVRENQYRRPRVADAPPAASHASVADEDARALAAARAILQPGGGQSDRRRP